MATLYIMRGLPGSGKTTKAKEIIVAHDPRRPIKRVNRDELRLMLDGGKHSKEREKFVKQIEENIILRSLENDIDVICDDTNLSPRTMEWLTNIASWVSRQFVDVDLRSVPPEECIYIADGMSSELTTASNLGMQAVLVETPHDSEYEHDRETWQGHRISSLKEVLNLI